MDWRSWTVTINELLIGNIIFLMTNVEIRKFRNHSVVPVNSFASSFSSNLDEARGPLELLPLGHAQLDGGGGAVLQPLPASLQVVC